jgi:hypothetical protein
MNEIELREIPLVEIRLNISGHKIAENCVPVVELH